MSDEITEHPTRLRTLSKLRDASTKAERLGLLSDLLGHFADDDEQLETVRATRAHHVSEQEQSADDDRLMSLGRALAELVDDGPGEMRKELAGEVESALNVLAGISARAQSGGGVELSFAADAFGQRAEPDKPAE